MGIDKKLELSDGELSLLKDTGPPIALDYETDITAADSVDAAQAKNDFTYCTWKIGVGDSRAVISEVAQIMRACRALEQYVSFDVYEGAARMVQHNSIAGSAEYLLENAKRYAELVQGGEYNDLDGKFGKEANAAPILEIIQKWEAWITEQSFCEQSIPEQQRKQTYRPRI